MYITGDDDGHARRTAVGPTPTPLALHATHSPSPSVPNLPLTMDIDPQPDPLTDAPIDPIWTASRTSRQIFALGEVEKVHTPTLQHYNTALAF